MQQIKQLYFISLTTVTLITSPCLAGQFGSQGLLPVSGIYEKSDAETVTIKTESGSLLVPKKYVKLEGLIAGKSKVVVKIPAKELLETNMKRKKASAAK
jgi:hypothetical protein